MKGSEFLAANAGKSLAVWEAAAVADPDSFVVWPLLPVEVAYGDHRGTFFVSQDVLAVGTPEDYVRLPLTPIAAQRIADKKGMLLPTSKMVDAIWRSGIHLTPQPMVPNKGANLAQYAQHSQLIDQQLSTMQVPSNGPAPVSGHKKDVIVSNIWKPGKVVIYGWHRPDGSHIQAKSNVHGDFYVDYSHGIRLVAPSMDVDGQTRNIVDVLKDRELAGLLSDEGPLRMLRYPTGLGNDVIAASTSPAGRLSYSELGLRILVALSQLQRGVT